MVSLLSDIHVTVHPYVNIKQPSLGIRVNGNISIISKTGENSRRMHRKQKFDKGNFVAVYS